MRSPSGRCLSVAVEGLTTLLLFTAVVVPQDAFGQAPIVQHEQGDDGDPGYTATGLAETAGSGTPGASGSGIVLGNSSDVDVSTESAVTLTTRGGRGGDGGDAFFDPSSDGDGGAGGAGGHGGLIYFDNQGELRTTGASSRHGIFAASTGGDGGDGGDKEVGIIGGDGGSGGIGGEVTLLNSGAITTASSESRAIWAQSIGGLGGEGGEGYIGGTGGGEGAAGTVVVNNSGSLITQNAYSIGIEAQSIGGGANAGGTGVIGGGAESAGDGGTTTVISSDAINTLEHDSIGILAQSIGGGGGNGGTGSGSHTVGGQAGGGGNGGTVDLQLVDTADVETAATRSHALLLQSIGGGGGHGGNAQAGGSSSTVAIGGTGGGGGDGGLVKAEIAEFVTVSTTGSNSFGLLAQSIGGGGGNGGYAHAEASGLLSASALAIGGNGGAGGDGGQVDLTLDGQITTTGDDSRGILAQSIGGGGGNGGASVASASALLSSSSHAVGGSGDVGGHGSLVTVTTHADGLIRTEGERSIALQAQSIGGGGGNGGTAMAFAGSLGLSSSTAVGGKGAGGGDGDKIHIESHARLITENHDSTAIQAQSIGGGGGNGGSAYSIAAGGVLGNSVSVGGDSDSGGDGDDVMVIATNTIDTTGNRSIGVQAQSIGGGGGNGGSSMSFAAGGVLSDSLSVGGSGGPGGGAGTVDVTTDVGITTEGDHADGLQAQSIGGGGGNGGSSTSLSVGGVVALGFSVGGSGGIGGSGDDVTVTQSGTVSTKGVQSHGVNSQSIGGGGGNGGYSVAGTASFGPAAASYAVGGSGGTGNTGGAVDVTSAGDIDTEGANSNGILAQSVGGGGGSGGMAVSLTGSATGGAASLTIGGNGGVGGDAGVVSVDAVSHITTQGDHGVGILAHSVGGGGGNGGLSIAGSGGLLGAATVTLGGAGGSGGVAEKVDLTSKGDLTTAGIYSHGLQAQSIGGGGGNGGFAISGSAVVSGAEVSAALGGDAGDGSTGGEVGVVNQGSVVTGGHSAHAINAQSIGGGGGNGGFAGALSASDETLASVSVAAGGTGGSGGDASAVSVSSSGERLSASGIGANAIHAQSIGGGGGDGGFALAASLSAEGSAATLDVALGGTGGGGGAGGTVVIANSSEVEVSGKNTNGILAQSIGGGGGNAGFAASLSGEGGSNKLQANVSLGGNGGSGNHASTVSVVNDSSITATGTERALGINAQSIGGGGGNGGLSFTGAINADSGSSPSTFGVGLGGSGGDGGQAGAVDVTHTVGTVSTQGIFSDGISAQSIGGGGGNGGASISTLLGYTGKGSSVNATATIGGNGGDGQTGNSVVATNNADISTAGIESRGLVARSVGGGGGNGGNSFTGILGASNATPDSTKTRTVKLTYNVGGTGGSGNHGGDATAVSQGTITTLGGSAYGIQAQSIGGGGGEGGDSHSKAFILGQSTAVGAMSDQQKSNISFTATIGGDGGDASHGGVVNARNEGTIETSGGNAVGVFAQSIGGGGGNGGNGALGTGESYIDDFGTIVTKISSLKRWDQFSVAVGGDGGSQGDGGDVSVENTGDITTHSEDAHGVHAQSIGGGGGIGGASVVGLRGTLGIGGSAGSGGDGGQTIIGHHQGTITTYGDSSSGVFAQSVGGGGGIAGNIERALAKEKSLGSVSVPALNIGLNYSFGGNGGDGGDGDDVSLTSTGDIVTHGEASYGIFAQSVGGGGGVIGTLGNEFLEEADFEAIDESKEDWTLAGHIGSVGYNGDGGNVFIDQDGQILTNGDRSHGIFAQSVGGEGHGADVELTISGEVLTQAEGTYGVLAQSDGALGRGSIFIDVSESGVVQGGAGDGAAVRFEDGLANELTNYGQITTTVGAKGTAVVGGDAVERIDNYGQISGSLFLGGGADVLVVHEGSLLESGSDVQLGDASETLKNHGHLAPGGSGTVETVMVTEIEGSFDQSASGVFVVDVDLSGDTESEQISDRLNVSGMADVAGTVTLSILNDGEERPGSFETTIIEAAGGATMTELALDAPESAIVRYDLVAPTSEQVVLRYGVDFAPEGLGVNEAAIGEFFNRTQANGETGGLTPLTAELISLASITELNDAYGQLSAEVHGSLQGVGLLNVNSLYQMLAAELRPTSSTYSPNRSVANNVPGIASSPDRVVPASYSDGSDGSDASSDPMCSDCSESSRLQGWVVGYGSGGRLDPYEAGERIRYSSGGSLVGVQYWSDDQTFIGGFVSYGKNWTNVSEPNQSAEVETTQAGFYVRRGEPDDAYTLLVASFGYDDYRTYRDVEIGPLSETAVGDFGGRQQTIYLERGNEVRLAGFLYSPYVSLQYTNLYRETFEEHGSTIANLRVQSLDSDFLRSGLGLRIVDDRHWLNPTVRMSWLHEFLDTDSVVNSSFTAAGAAGSFSTFGPQLSRDSFTYGAGGGCLLTDNTYLSLSFDGQVSDKQLVHAGSARIEVTW